MTDKWFLSANDDTAAVKSAERVCVTPLNRHKIAVSYTVELSISVWVETGEAGGEKSAAIEPVSRAEPEGFQSSAGRKSKTHSMVTRGKEGDRV